MIIQDKKEVIWDIDNNTLSPLEPIGAKDIYGKNDSLMTPLAIANLENRKVAYISRTMDINHKPGQYLRVVYADQQQLHKKRFKTLEECFGAIPQGYTFTTELQKFHQICGVTPPVEKIPQIFSGTNQYVRYVEEETIVFRGKYVSDENKKTITIQSCSLEEMFGENLERKRLCFSEIPKNAILFKNSTTHEYTMVHPDFDNPENTKPLEKFFKTLEEVAEYINNIEPENFEDLNIITNTIDMVESWNDLKTTSASRYDCIFINEEPVIWDIYGDKYYPLEAHSHEKVFGKDFCIMTDQAQNNLEVHKIAYLGWRTSNEIPRQNFRLVYKDKDGFHKKTFSTPGKCFDALPKGYIFTTHLDDFHQICRKAPPTSSRKVSNRQDRG